VTVRATGTLKLQERSNIRSETQGTTLEPSPSEAPAGTIDVTAGTIELRRNSTIRTNTFGQGDAGNVIVHADSISIDGTDAELSTGIASNAGDSNRAGIRIGNAGKVVVNAHRIDLVEGGTIQTETWGRSGGTVLARADHLVISGLGNTGILSRARRNARTGNAAIGNAGSITNGQGRPG
jgi:hypothetical protein